MYNPDALADAIVRAIGRLDADGGTNGPHRGEITGELARNIAAAAMRDEEYEAMQQIASDRAHEENDETGNPRGKD